MVQKVAQMATNCQIWQHWLAFRDFPPTGRCASGAWGNGKPEQIVSQRRHQNWLGRKTSGKDSKKMDHSFGKLLKLLLTKWSIFGHFLGPWTPYKRSSELMISHIFKIGMWSSLYGLVKHSRCESLSRVLEAAPLDRVIFAAQFCPSSLLAALFDAAQVLPIKLSH